MCRMRMKGRMPKAILIFAFFSMWLELFIMVLGWMRKTEGGYNLFIQVRYWSWWGVETESQVEWLEWAAQQCDYFTKNNLMFVGCQSPICIWYRLKCKMYNEMAVYQYIVACVMSLALILQFRALLWTTSFSPRELRYAFVSMFCAMWSFVITFFGFDMAMDAVFSQLDRESYYPNPPYYVGTYFLWIVMLLCLMRVLCNGYLYAKAREFEQSETSSESSADDMDEVAAAKAQFARMKGKKVASGMGKGKMRALKGMKG